jgi:hypothetical protein
MAFELILGRNRYHHFARVEQPLLLARLKMTSTADYAVVIDALDDELRNARELQRGLFGKVIAAVCTRLQLLRKLGRAGQLDRLADAGAWTDAALALIALELPAWKVRRLACENGEWLCSLSRQPHTPIMLDDTAEAGHEALPLAILRAFIEARRRSSLNVESAPATVQSGRAPGFVLCCDNFA